MTKKFSKYFRSNVKQAKIAQVPVSWLASSFHVVKRSFHSLGSPPLCSRLLHSLQSCTSLAHVFNAAPAVLRLNGWFHRRSRQIQSRMCCSNVDEQRANERVSWGFRSTAVTRTGGRLSSPSFSIPLSSLELQYSLACVFLTSRLTRVVDMPPKKSKVEGINQKLALVIKSGKVRLLNDSRRYSLPLLFSTHSATSRPSRRSALARQSSSSSPATRPRSGTFVLLLLAATALFLPTDLSDNRCSKSEIEYYALLSKTLVEHFKGDNVALGTACGKLFRVCTLAITDPGDSDIITSLSEN